jgi:hypothetical protein
MILFQIQEYKNKTFTYSYRTILLYIATLVLLRACLIYKYNQFQQPDSFIWVPDLSSRSSGNKTVHTIYKYNLSYNNISLTSKSYIRKILFITLFLSYFAVGEATLTRQQAVDIIQTVWTAYIAYRTTIIKYTPTIPWTALRHINVATLNIRGGFDAFTKRIYITHKCLEKDMDFMAIHRLQPQKPISTTMGHQSLTRFGRWLFPVVRTW